MLTPSAALVRWKVATEVCPSPDAGLINQTWLVGRPPSHVLQWVNPIFSARVNDDIAALTERLADRGLLTPRLVAPTAGGWSVDDPEGGSWRLMTFVPGRTLHRLDGPDARAAAEQAGAMLGRFHAALDGWDYRRRDPRGNPHTTLAHLDTLRVALDGCEGHALAGPARELGQQILSAWDTWEGTLDLPDRCCHGDPKISNIRFDPVGQRALCMIDLDTVNGMPLACELGDAWRSWCNPAGEDELERVRFDVELFAASARGYLRHAPALTSVERASLVPGIERICLELAARFCADAVNNRYFREDRGRFGVAGAHNLHRARVHVVLARQAREQRITCERVIG